MTALKWITTEAKKIRKKYPKKEWKDCVAQASAIYARKHKGKSPIGKKKKKTVGAVKKVAKKKTAKKSGGYHKDTKSHNVRINVVSGFNQNEFYVNKLKMLSTELEKANKQKSLLDIEWKKNDKNFKQRNLIWKKHWPERIKMIKKMISETKKHIK